MKVLRIAHHAPVAAWRQRERELIALGEDVTLVSSLRWNEGGRDVELAPETDGSGDRFVVGARTLGTHPNLFVYDPRPLWRLLGQDWDLIDLHEEPCSVAVAEVRLLAWLRGRRAPYVLYSAQNIDKRYPVPFRWFERSALRGAAGAYVCNREAGEILARKGLRGPAPLIPLGVDTAVLAPTDRQAPGTRLAHSVGYSVGYVGRLEPHKGVDVLLRATAMRPSWQVEIFGDGPQRAALEAQATPLGDRVRFAGHLEQAALAERLRRLDVLVVPSLPTPGWLEQFCRVAVEAMACGVPVVASDSGALPDVVADAGLLFPPGDADALAVRVDEALARWSELRARGLVRASDFTWRAVARAQQHLYRKVVPVSGPRKDPQIVIVAYGDPAMLADCLDALDAGGQTVPLTVVDNSSLAATRELVERHGGRYLDPGRNLGFGAGVNVALRDLAERGLDGHDVLLLNPDARIGVSGIRAMQARLRGRVGVVGATQTDPVSGAQTRVWWPFPTPAGAWREALGLGRLNRRRDFAIGSILLLRAETVRAVGPFDERFFLYAEETDWQLRARRAGWSVAVVDAEATHVGAGTGGDPTFREGHFYASQERYVRKHHGTLGWQTYRAANVVGSAARAVLRRGPGAAAARRRLTLFLRGPVRALEAGR